VADFFTSTLLVIDDEETNLVLLQRMLSRKGYTRVETIQDSRQALQAIGALQPDLILLDLMMPHVDGYEIMTALREKQAKTDFLPILVLTADTTARALERALSGGATDFLTKPFNQTELLLRVRNLLEARHLSRALQQQLEGLDALSRDVQQTLLQQNESLSAVSHDLGQPLAALRYTVDALRENLDRSESDEVKSLRGDVEVVFKATLQLAGMVGALSDMARLQMGRDLVLDLSEVDLGELARTQFELAKRTTRRHRLSIELPAKPLIGRWDEVRLTRVLSNLLHNAIKFSPNGGRVRLSVKASDDGVDALIEVEDEGMGIPPEELPRIFDAFHRGTNVAGVPGSGLGLATAQKVVMQHGGRIEVNSTPAVGTCVRVYLPLK
jgi:signal transduction histidine kinase